jgi:23S rRNA (adenine1618-N6)-methyltransferase
MLGKLSSVSLLVEKLIGMGNHNYAVTEFVQGNKTRRWAIAWSWTDLRPTVVCFDFKYKRIIRDLTLHHYKRVARGISSFPKHLLPFPSEYTFELPNCSIDDIGKSLNAELSSLHIHWTWSPKLGTGVGFAPENVWSRQYRRKMKISESEEKPDVDEKKAALGFKVQLKMDPAEKTVRVVVRWLKGTDTVLFESFCGMVKRKLEGR